MSRLRAITIPFVQGQDDRIDDKILPDGTLARVRNGRLRKAGELALRRGWRPVAMLGAADEGGSVSSLGEVRDLYSTGDALVARTRRLGRDTLLTYTNTSAARPWTIRAGIDLPPLTHVRSMGNLPDLPDSVTRASAAVTSDGVWGAVLFQSATTAILRVFRMATDETIFQDTLSNPTQVMKVVSMGAAFGLVKNTGSALALFSYTPATPNLGLVSVGTLETVTATHFDVAVAQQTTPTALHVVTTEASGAVVYRQYTFAGAQTGSDRTVVASGARSAFVVCDDLEAQVVYQSSTTGELSLLSFEATGAFTTVDGPTAVDAGVDIENDCYAVGYGAFSGVTGWPRVHIVARLDEADVADSTRVYETASALHSFTSTTFLSTSPACGWVGWERDFGFGAVRGDLFDGLDQVFLDPEKLWAVPGHRVGALVATGQTPFFPGVAPSGDVLVLWPRGSDTSTTTGTAGRGFSRSRQVTVRAARIGDTGRRPGVSFGGALYLAGGILTQALNGGICENGILRPVIFSLTASASIGNIANGTYSYRALVVWTDEGGRVHRSVVSDPVDVTTTGSNDTVTAVIHIPKTLRRDPNAVFDPVVELYRTEAGPGELFYLTSAAVVDTDDATSVLDLSADATILDSRRLYTEGEFGTVSGALDIAPPDPCSFVAAMRDRLVLGGGGSTYQVSQTALPEEPVAFTQPGVSGPVALAYQDSVEGRLTGVATLDDTIVLGTATQLFVSGGEGPNLTGVGEFQSPARLPTDVGFYDFRSVVEDATGLWFLGDRDKLYVLPRGQGSPSFAGEAVQDQFADEVVGAGRDSQDGVTAWVVADGTAVLRHAEEGQWLGDDLPFDPVAFVAHQGQFFAVDDAGDVWVQDASAYGDAAAGATAVVLVAETGDVQSFGAGGLAGWGRLGVVELLGEFRASASVLCEISYDSGLSWTSLGAHAVTGLSAGQAFSRQWYPANQRGGKFRVRFTMTPTVTTTEGCRLAGFTLFYTQRNGQTRLDSAKRR